jgi:putative N6-adenine-specific DNA methylase
MKNTPKATTHEKRIKRRVTGRDHEFFAVTLPGLEALCLNELESLGIDEKTRRVSKGGVSFQGRVHDAYAANLHLRTASRILMRIDRFQATGFRQMEKHITEFPWELYLHTDQAYDLKVTSSRSRLIHTDAIAERFKQGIATRFTGRTGLAPIAGKTPPPQKLFIRGVADRFTVSIDSSGEPLYKRGLKTTGGQAPLRETFAAAALMLTGFSPGNTLVDPMCGTGSFSLEAAMISNRIPPGWYREFAFFGWPCFRPGRWKHLRKIAREIIQPAEKPIIFASDLDPDATGKLKRIVKEFDLDAAVQVECKDFFLPDPAGLAASPGTITLNPPYGVRIKTESSIDKLYAGIGRHLSEHFTGWNLALILPEKKLLRHLPFKVETMAFTHGGLRLILATGRIK